MPQAAKLAKEFFYGDRIKQLEMRPTREELGAMKPDLLRSWQALPLEERSKYENLHQGNDPNLLKGFEFSEYNSKCGSNSVRACESTGNVVPFLSSFSQHCPSIFPCRILCQLLE